MATKQYERVEAAHHRGPAGPAGTTRRRGRCVEVVGGQGSTVVRVRLGDGRELDLVVPAAPDPVLARRLTGGLRRVSWVSIDTSGVTPRCEVAGVSRRPQRRRLPMAAALALAGAAVPTVVRVPDQGA